MPQHRQAQRGLPTYEELCRDYGFSYYEVNGWVNPEGVDRPTPPVHVRSDSGAEAWSFVLQARARGWAVSDPMPNGLKDVHHVTVWMMGAEDATAGGRFRRGN